MQSKPRKYLFPIQFVDERSGESYECDPVYMDWLRVRQVIEHEDYLLIERAKLLIAIQTILSAMIYFVTEREVSNYIPAAICFFGICMSLHLTVGMYKAKKHQNKLIRWWFSRLGCEDRESIGSFGHPFLLLAKAMRIGGNDECRDQTDLPTLMRRQPPVAGKDPNYLRWVLPYWCIGIFFVFIWMSGLYVFVVDPVT